MMLMRKDVDKQHSIEMSGPTIQCDQSDQGSVDSDYTSYASSKLCPASMAGSTSSLYHQGRSFSIESHRPSIIPTRHINRSKSTIDPLQFVKIQPNQELIERAQEQFILAETRKLRERQRRTSSYEDEQNDWSKMGCGSAKSALNEEKNAVENWRQKRMKKVQSMVQTDPPAVLPSSKPEESAKPIPIYESVNKAPSPPPPSAAAPAPLPRSKSPSPVRRKGTPKIREISMEKPAEMRGFGFKLDGGRNTNRPVFISTIEDGSPADRSGLNVDDEVLGINGQSIENLPFDQVRKILKERNLRGTIQLTVRTFDETQDETPSAPLANSNPPAPVYTFLPYAPSKPARSTDLDHPTLSAEPEMKFSRKELLTLMTESSPIVAFRQLLEPGRYTENIYDKELQDLEAEFEKQLKGIDQMNNDRPSSPVKTSTQVIINLPSTPSNNDVLREVSPITQVRSYVEKQMDQLKHDLETGFSRASKAETTGPSALKKSISTQNELDRVPSTRGYGLVINPNERVIHYLDPYTPQRPLSQYIQRSIPDLSSMSNVQRNFPQTQKKVTIQLDESPSSKRKQFNRMKRTHFDENLYIDEDERRPPPPQRRSQSHHPRLRTKSPIAEAHLPTVSGKLHCSRCHHELGKGSAMVIESLGLYYHMECFRCYVCHIPLSTALEGIDVRIRNHRLHCQNCFSDDRGVKLSAV